MNMRMLVGLGLMVATGAATTASGQAMTADSHGLSLDCGFGTSGNWLQAFREAVERGEVVDPGAALATYMEVYTTAGWYSIGAGLLCIALAPLLKYFMHGIR